MRVVKRISKSNIVGLFTTFDRKHFATILEQPQLRNSHTYLIARRLSNLFIYSHSFVPT